MAPTAISKSRGIGKAARMEIDPISAASGRSMNASLSSLGNCDIISASDEGRFRQNLEPLHRRQIMADALGCDYRSKPNDDFADTRLDFRCVRSVPRPQDSMILRR